MAYKQDPATGAWYEEPDETFPEYPTAPPASTTPAPAPGAPAPAPAPGTPPPPAGGASNPLYGNAAAFRDAWYASGGKTVTDLKNFVAAHPEYGATITGSKGSKITFPGGGAYQAVRSAGIGGGIGPAWDDLSGGGGGEGGSVPIGDFGSFAKGFGKDFHAPTLEELEAMPDYQFVKKQGLEGIDTGAAAKGTLLTGGNQKDRAEFASGLASTYGQQKYQNALQEYLQQYSIFRNDNNDIWSRYNDLSSRGSTAANQATS